MTFNAPSYSDSPRNSTNYLGQNYRFTPTYIRKRNPVNGTSLSLQGDIKPKENQGRYPIGSIWVNVSNPPEIWILAAINANGAQWVLIANSLLQGPLLTLSDNAGTVVTPTSDVANPPGNIQILAGAGITVVAGTNNLTITNTGAGTETLTGDDAVAVSPSAGTIQTLGNTVANSTHAKPLFTTNSAGNIERFDIQVSAAIGATNINKAGIASFSNAQFAVDANGFVTLAGGAGAPTLGITPDASTPPGTSPVVPNGSGNIILEGGATFATGTRANPIRTNSLAANTVDLQIQLAGANAAVSTANNFGVSQFDSNSFGVASGYVTLNNAGTTGAATKVLGDDGGANSVVPSSGTINWTGVTVTNATNAKPVFFKKNAASTEELDVQLATTSTSAAKSINKSGLCHFDSTDFTVDAATGFVQLTGGAAPAVQTLTGNSGGAIPPTGSPENISTVGTGSITIAGAGNTLTTQLTGLTNHNVLVGAGTATITNVAPSATSGVPLISQGAAADPTFGTAVVAGGGTGSTTFTAFSVVCAGTTSTGPFQNVSGVGSANQVLTSNGAAALPTWQGVSASGATTQFTLDAATTPITPSAGNVTLTGGQVATGVVGANVIRTRGNNANSATIEIQRSTVAGAANSTLNGVCHFSSSQFGVDANGFVTFTASTGNIPWTDESSNFNASSNNGYFCTAVLTATLPATPAQGDTVRVVADTASVVTIAANTGQKIRIGNVISALAGTAASTKQGDSLVLVFRSASSVWYSIGGPQGTWTVT